MKNISAVNRFSFAGNRAAIFFAMALLPSGFAYSQSKKDTTMKEKTIEEVVMIGYGTQKKSDVNSAISSVKAKDLQDIKQTSVDQMLQGKLAGVTVTNSSGQPGAATSVRVRGATSLGGINEPLYIIDGVPISGDATGFSTSGRPIAGNDFSSTGGSGSVAVSPISFLNPNDIESIDVLKDASATAIYGSRGANGVIIITTKSGKKGTGKLSYEGFTSISSIYKFLDVMNLQEYAKYENDLAVQFNRPDAVRPEFAHPELLGKGTDWQNEIFRTALSQSHQLAFSGGKEDVNYYTSLSYLDQQGNVINTAMKRYTIRMNLDAKVKPWLKVGTNVTAGISKENYTINQSYTGIIVNTLMQAPDLAVRNLDGSYALPEGDRLVNYFNPVQQALTLTHDLTRKNFLGNIYSEASLLKGLKYRIEIAANTEFSENTEFTPKSKIQNLAQLTERRQNWYSINIKNLLTYDFSLDRHKFTVLAGQEANDSHWEGIYGTGKGFLSNEIYTLTLADTKTVDSYKGSSSTNSYFARLIYDFDGRYGLSASVRRDQSSKFDPDSDNQVGYFPAVALSWRVTNEPFMQWIPSQISNIKIRAGYGETGNQQIPNDRYTSLLTQYYYPGNMNNPDLKWETMIQKNLGIDMTLFKNLNLTVDLYDKRSKDFLFQLPLPGYLTGGESYYGGMSAPWSNIGSMSNKGVDFNISYKTNGEDFNWSTSLNISHYSNKLLSLSEGLANINRQVNLNGYLPMVATNTVVGQPIGMFWGYKTDGLFTSEDQLRNAPIQFGQSVGTANDENHNANKTWLGDVKYVDVNGDGVIDQKDMTFIGNPHPDFTFGFTNTFRYKNIDLSIFIQGSVGNDVMNLTRRNGTQNAMLYQNQLKEAANYWTVDNPNTDIPRPVSSNSNPNLLISDRFIEKGDYARIQNLTLGYTLPSEISSTLKLSRLRIYATAQNLLTITKYKGYDPEVGSFNQDVLLTGVDNGRYPSPRTFTFGVNLDF
ncbi:SusC/RagA family TonB-linked outer membrane protein [Daejeonia sp. YH14]|uniref:SusC/RagA family TonB-linked outer membrane protein n=1 Tax=Daejeonia sp. YH14 TaxID=3439042 RepID=UPI003F494623